MTTKNKMLFFLLFYWRKEDLKNSKLLGPISAVTTGAYLIFTAQLSSFTSEGKSSTDKYLYRFKFLNSSSPFIKIKSKSREFQ